MGATQQFSLRWNNYVQHITCAFDSLRTDEDLVDVTLSCEGRKIYAHKMLLSACSNYFKDVFKENPCKHPVIIFRNVKYEDLLAIVDFMYHGEVNVEQEQLSSFLTTAEMLAVQGLSVGSTTPRGEPRKRQPVFLDTSPVATSQDMTHSRPSSVKVASRPLGTQNPPSPRPPTPPRKRRLSPLPSKPSGGEKETVHKRRLLKLETEECEEPEDEEDGMMDVSQLDVSRETDPLASPSAPTIKMEAPPSPEMDKVSGGMEQPKAGQPGTSTHLETAGRGETLQVEEVGLENEEEEYLEEEMDEDDGEVGYEDDGEVRYETAWVVVGADGEYEYMDGVDASALLTGQIPGREDTIHIEEPPKPSRSGKRKQRENMALVLEADAANESHTVQYIYAEAVNENNEIVIGEVPKYVCEQCDRTFKRLDSLYKHNSVHTGRTACPACGAVFSRIAHRARHMRIKHPELPALTPPRAATRKGKHAPPKG